MGRDSYCSRHGRWVLGHRKRSQMPPSAPNQLESYLSPTSLSCPSGTPSPPGFPGFTPATRNLSKKNKSDTITPWFLDPKALGIELGILSLILRTFLEMILSFQFQLSVMPTCSLYHSHPKQLCPGSAILAHSFLSHLLRG